MGHSVESILEAAKRVADKVFDATQQSAKDQLFASNAAGRLSSSSHIEAEQRIFVEGYGRLCEEASERVVGLATEGVAAYVGPLENLLRQYWTPVVNEFLNYAVPGEAQGIIRNEANKSANQMNTDLERTMAAALQDFRLNFPPDGAPIRVSDAIGELAERGQRDGNAGYAATVLKVMIASPSDVAIERTIIRDVIHEWNAVHSEDRAIVLMPVGWESHSSPAMGARPQEIINKQILRGCDILVGVFWTKFGTPTGKAGSGTAEEIEEHVRAGKHALIYFSSEPVHPDSINPEQYKALKAFEAEMLKEGLVERYDTKASFKDKFARQLAQTIIREFGRGGEVVTRPGGGHPTTSDPEPVPTSEEAAELLLQASKDKGGIVMRVQFIGGTEVQTNGRQFIASRDARTEAKWRAAVDELAALGFLEDRNGKGEVFFMTNDGYARADRLAQGL